MTLPSFDSGPPPSQVVWKKVKAIAFWTVWIGTIAALVVLFLWVKFLETTANDYAGKIKAQHQELIKQDEKLVSFALKTQKDFAEVQEKQERAAQRVAKMSEKISFLDTTVTKMQKMVKRLSKRKGSVEVSAVEWKGHKQVFEAPKPAEWAPLGPNETSDGSNSYPYAPQDLPSDVRN